jgi:hypothetical protein
LGARLLLTVTLGKKLQLLFNFVLEEVAPMVDNHSVATGNSVGVFLVGLSPNPPGPTSPGL